jgi:hypothetical protein
MIQNTIEVTERTEMLGGNSVVNITGANFDPVSIQSLFLLGRSQYSRTIMAQRDAIFRFWQNIKI